MLGLATARARSTGSRHRRDRPRRADLPVMQPCRMSSWRPAIAATVFHNGRSGVSMPTSYADLQDHTEAQSQTTWERESQTSISGSRTLHFASSRGCVQQIQVHSGRRAARCSGRNSGSNRKEAGTFGDRPPTTYRRPRYGRSALMQGLAYWVGARGLSIVGWGSAFLPGA